MACSPKTHPWLLNLSSGWVWKEWLHSTSAKWLVDLRADYNVAEHEHHLDWLTQGRAILIMKDSHKHTAI